MKRQGLTTKDENKQPVRSKLKCDRFGRENIIIPITDKTKDYVANH